MRYPKDSMAVKVRYESRLCEIVGFVGVAVRIRHVDDCLGCQRGIYDCESPSLITPLTPAARDMLAIVSAALKGGE